MSVIQEFANIPSARLRHLGNRLKEIQEQKARLASEEADIRALATRELGLGNYETMTVYQVSACDVSGYHRRGYKAVRVRAGLVQKQRRQKK